MPVLNRTEIAALRTGKKRTDQVKAHERVCIQRAPQQIKDNTIYGFAIAFTNQLERHGVSPHDKRHIANLITHLGKTLDKLS